MIPDRAPDHVVPFAHLRDTAHETRLEIRESLAYLKRHSSFRFRPTGLG